MECNAVFEGGGVRGAGLAGAVAGFTEAGYTFNRLAGSSAGAIVAALTAAGYGAAELEQSLKSVDFKKFKEKNALNFLGLAGDLISFGIDKGVYSADYFEGWLGELLRAKNAVKFGDLQRRLQVTASDLSAGKLLVLPDDLHAFGIDGADYPIAKAVRMSMSIPVFFKPFILNDSVVVDGGLISNYPVWIIDDGKNLPDIPTFGFRFVKSPPAPRTAGGAGGAGGKGLSVHEYFSLLISTLIDAQDDPYLHISKGDLQRTVNISVADENGRAVSATDFDVTPAQTAALFQNGLDAARKFLSGWDFEIWKTEFRKNACPAAATPTP